MSCNEAKNSKNETRYEVLLILTSDLSSQAENNQNLLKYTFSVFMTKLKNLENSYMNKADFLSLLKTFKANLDDALVDQYIQECTVNIDGKPLMNVHLMANHYLNRHPKGGKQAIN